MSTNNDSGAPQSPLNDPEFQRYINNLKAFIALFPPGKMSEELWHLACTLYEKHDEADWQHSGRFTICGMYKRLTKLCKSMQAIVAYFEPQMNADNGADER